MFPCKWSMIRRPGRGVFSGLPRQEAQFIPLHICLLVKFQMRTVSLLNISSRAFIQVSILFRIH